jgi:hypothetical protein
MKCIIRVFWVLFVALLLPAFLTACGGGVSSKSTIAIENPVSEPTYLTNQSQVIVGGSVSGASFVKCTNSATATTLDAYVNYFEGHGSWFCDPFTLDQGDNLISCTTEKGASDSITITYAP